MEVITCRAGNDCLRLLCKYSAGCDRVSCGHRGGVAYEAQVYRHVLRDLELPIPRLHGVFDDPATGWTWLIVEHVDQSVRVTNDPKDAAVFDAARWIGRFHALQEPRTDSPAIGFLQQHTKEYYHEWLRRTAEVARRRGAEYAWVERLCAEFAEPMDLLLAQHRTVIHGEYYPSNIRLRRGQIYPIDWESAALAAGEIDLAAVTQGWDEATIRRCEQEYCDARWPGGAPADFPRVLDAARAYFLFRWLGEYPEWDADERRRLAALAQSRGLLIGRDSA